MKLRLTNGVWAFGREQPTDLSGIPDRTGPNPRGSVNRKSPLKGGTFARILRTVIQPYGIAVVSVALAFSLTFLLRYFFPYPVLFLFFAAVMVSAWFGGTGAGLFAVLLSTLVADYFFVPPFNSFEVSATNVSYFAAFVICAFVASWVSATKKKAEMAILEARDQLELRVEQRTAQLQQSHGELVAREHELEKSNWELREHERQLELSIEQRKKTEQALMKSQAELAHLSRVLTMGELTSSIAHEITQPLTAVVIHGDAGLTSLAADPPALDDARQAFEKIIEDGTRAGAVLGRIRTLFKKEALSKAQVDMNELIQELLGLLRDQTIRNGVTIETTLASDLPRIYGDRVQLQQVLLNLALNAIDATSHLVDRSRRLRISTAKTGDEILIAVEDSGIGIRLETADRIFDAFYTTKPQGIGMGLPISRSIVESHGGRLWATPLDQGALFQFTIPIEPTNQDV